MGPFIFPKKPLVKIGLLIDELAPGSTPKLIGWPIRKLAALGVEAEALAIVEKDHWQRHRTHYDFHLDGVKVRYLFREFPVLAQRFDFRFPGMSFFSLHHPSARLWAHRAVGRKEFDILIACCQYSTFAALNLKRRRGIPFITLVWDPSVFTARKIYRHRLGWRYWLILFGAALLDRYAIRECEAIITSGHFHHAYWRRLTRKPLEVLYPGCFPLDRLPDFSARERLIITWDRWDIGNLPHVFLDLLERVEDRQVRLALGGFWHPESLKEDFQRELGRRQLSERVDLLGPLNENDIQTLCSRAMVHVHAVHEAFGMQTLEAAGCGCPGIIPAGSGVAELFEDGRSGLHPPPGDFGALVEATNRIFADATFARRMGEAAWAVARRHTWDNYAETLRNIVERYAGRQEGRNA